ncbi:MAG: hypothetical protein RMK99_05920 [Anaerolineales bacterium]|nr:hypothetical protein [Anaerolineales bacterium]
MSNRDWQRPLFLSLTVLAGAVVCLLFVIAVFGLLTLYQAADHPDAVLISDYRQYRWMPVLHFRRDTSYRAPNEFPELYHWYSRRFELGPEVRAESACILMQRAGRVLLLEHATSVMLCDATDTRLIYVTRTFTLRYR